MRLRVPSFGRIVNGRRAILDMKNQRDKLRQYQKRITVLTDREKAIAKECLLKGDTNKAKLALRRKKYQEGLIQKTDAQLAQLEQLTSDVEFALVQKDVLYGLQQGTAVLKEIHKEMGGIENVEKLLGENAEARAYQEVRAMALPYHLRDSCSLSAFDVSLTSVTGNQRAPRKQDVEPRRRRSRGRAGASRATNWAAHCTYQCTRVHTGREGADSKRPGAKTRQGARRRGGTKGRTHSGIAMDWDICALSEALGTY